MNAPVVELKHTWKTYQAAGRGTVGVMDVELTVEGGKLVLLLGPSGSGKTTLLTLMAGLVAPSSGTVAIGRRRLDRLSPVELQRLRARDIGVVFQAFNLIDALTALENVALVLQFAGNGRREARAAAGTVLAGIGIGNLGAQLTSQLSQGEKQRVAIARAIANRPVLLLADEPTASLDSGHGLEIIEILRRYARDSQAAVVVSTHDPRLADFADQILHISDGKMKKRD